MKVLKTHFDFFEQQAAPQHADEPWTCGDDWERHWFREQFVGNKPADGRNAPHNARHHRWEDRSRINVGLVFLQDAIHGKVERAGNVNPAKLGENVVQCWKISRCRNDMKNRIIGLLLVYQ